ncbi:hypothetical protein GCM10025776_29680 [Corallincola platygyrae]
MWSLFIAIILTACGGSGGSSADNPPEQALPGAPEVHPPEVAPEPDPIPMLTWGIPTTRTDKTELASWEIDKYQVLFGKDRFKLELLDEVPGGSSSPGLSLESLNPGYYFFSVTVIDVNGLASDSSEVILRKVPDDFLDDNSGSEGSTGSGETDDGSVGTSAG